jgi:activating signal cointegrator 1
VKLLTLPEPLASLIFDGCVEYVTKSFNTSYRGEVLIRSAKHSVGRKAERAWEAITEKPAPDFSFSAENILGIVKLVNCQQIVPKACVVESVTIDPSSVDSHEKLLNNWKVGRFAWQFAEIDQPFCLDIEAKDAPQGFVDVPSDLAEIVQFRRNHYETQVLPALLRQIAKVEEQLRKEEEGDDELQSFDETDGFYCSVEELSHFFQ